MTVHPRSSAGNRGEPPGDRCSDPWHIAALGCGAAIALALGGCAGPPVLGQQVIAYDEVAKTLDEKLLLLNIARVDRGETVHFTSTSSIAATFDWTTTIGAGGRINSGAGAANFLDLNIGASASENPTFSIIPVAGEEFTRRIATPFTEEAFELLVFQGGRIDQVMRLMAAGIEVQEKDGRFVRFIENNPRRPKEYEEFRRITMHLQWLNDHRRLFARTLVFEETLVANTKAVPSPEDINNGFDKGLRWRQKPDGNYELTRLRAGRVLISNYDPMALTDQQRFALNERIAENPKGFAYVDIRPDGPGGTMALQGAIKLRSMFQILAFLAQGIRVAPEFEVAPGPTTGEVEVGPRATMKINLTDTPPRGSVPSIYYDGKYYAVDDTHWDRRSFLFLSVLFQTTVGNVEKVGIPITISK